MNNQSPLIPQGSLLEQKNKGRARVKIAVFVVLAIHGIGLLALLMQGCKKEPEGGLTATDQTNTNTAPAFAEPTNAPPPFTNPPTMAAPAPSLVDTNPPTLAQPAAAGEYKVARGDTFTSIARKFHVTINAVKDANPGVDSSKLQIGQTLHIPAAPAATVPSPTTGTTPPGPEATGGEQTYTVQSGDTLIGIAGHFKVGLKALRSVNNLTTDKIKVGQKLKIPAKAATPAGTTSSVPTSASGSGATPSGQ